MQSSKLSNAVVTALVILFLLFCANLVLGLGLTLVGLFFGLVGGILKLLFTKEVFMLAGIGLVIYLYNRDRKPVRDYYHY